MTKDEILNRAKQACQEGDSPFVSGWITMDYNEFERFAALVAEKERDSCAKVCDDFAAHYWAKQDTVEAVISEECAAAIRARGKSDKQD
jgi:hypothetical protein